MSQNGNIGVPIKLENANYPYLLYVVCHQFGYARVQKIMMVFQWEHHVCRCAMLMLEGVLMNNCLTCKYEPEWIECISTSGKRGICKIPLPPISSNMDIQRR